MPDREETDLFFGDPAYAGEPEENRPQDTCPQCGYPTWSIKTGHCPSCGRPIGEPT